MRRHPREGTDQEPAHTAGQPPPRPGTGVAEHRAEQCREEADEQRYAGEDRHPGHAQPRGPGRPGHPEPEDEDHPRGDEPEADQRLRPRVVRAPALDPPPRVVGAHPAGGQDGRGEDRERHAGGQAVAQVALDPAPLDVRQLVEHVRAGHHRQHHERQEGQHREPLGVDGAAPAPQDTAPGVVAEGQQPAQEDEDDEDEEEPLQGAGRDQPGRGGPGRQRPGHRREGVLHQVRERGEAGQPQRGAVPGGEHAVRERVVRDDEHQVQGNVGREPAADRERHLGALVEGAQGGPPLGVPVEQACGAHEGLERPRPGLEVELLPGEAADLGQRHEQQRPERGEDRPGPVHAWPGRGTRPGRLSLPLLGHGRSPDGGIRSTQRARRCRRRQGGHVDVVPGSPALA